MTRSLNKPVSHSLETGETSRPIRLRRPYQPEQSDTRPLSRNPETWLARAETAEILEDSLLYLNRALALNPQHRVASYRMDIALQYILSHNAYRGYVDENRSLYRVQTGANLVLHVSKDRAVPEPYPSKSTSPLQQAYYWLALALLGLPLAGLGTLISLPIVLMYAIRAHRQPLSPADQFRGDVVVTIAFVLSGMAFVLALLLVLHL